jgi:hypothetical protein
VLGCRCRLFVVFCGARQLIGRLFVELCHQWNDCLIDPVSRRSCAADKFEAKRFKNTLNLSNPLSFRGIGKEPMLLVAGKKVSEH